MRPVELERAATALVETTMPGKKCRDAEVAKKYGISARSLQRYRASLDTNQELAALVAKKLSALEDRWLESLPTALAEAVDFLTKAAQQCDPKDPAAIEAVAKAFEKLTEAKAVNDMIRARITGQAQAPRGQDRSVAPRGAAPDPVH